MLYSMTGFGKATCNINNQNYNIEIKTLNSKQLDINLKNANTLKDIEIDIRKTISNNIIRGKVDIQFTEEKADKNAVLNFDAIEKIYQSIVEFSSKKNIPIGDVFPSILRMSDVIKTEQFEITETDKLNILAAFDQAILALNLFRKNEGSVLEIDILQRIEIIQNLQEELSIFEPLRTVKIKEKLHAELSQLSISIDQNRLEQELIFYIEKLDITEEKIRLQAHCNYFLEICNNTEIEKGKKLGFVVQEIGREINTIGSKANDANMQKIVVQMKDELEKIKEQLNNIV
jgi:uncharacterized protein (TIGR00255 family)